MALAFFRTSGSIRGTVCAVAVLVASTAFTGRVAAQCAGDCDGDERVSIADLITGVAISLDQEDLERCPSVDGDGNEAVSIDELVRAVQLALEGCAEEPTPGTATPTVSTPTGSTPTATIAITATQTPPTPGTPTPTMPPSPTIPSGVGLSLGGEFEIHTEVGEAGEGPCLLDQPRAALAPTGLLNVVWEDGACRRVRGRQMNTDGQPTGDVFRVNVFTVIASDLAIEQLRDGFVVVWDEEFAPGLDTSTFDGSSSTVIAQRFDAAAGKVGTEFQVNSFTVGSQRAPAVGAASDGSFVVVWIDDSGYESVPSRVPIVVGQRYDSAGGPIGGEFQVNESTSRTHGAADVAMRQDGRFVVAWAAVNDPRSIFARRFGADGAPLGAEFLVSAHTVANDPSVTVDSSGGFAIAWNGANAVVARRYEEDGQPLGTEFTVAGGDESRIGQPIIVPVPDGGFVVAWDEYDPAIAAAIFRLQRTTPSGEASGRPVVLDAGTDLTTDGQGHFAVVWDEENRESARGRYLGIPEQ